MEPQEICEITIRKLDRRWVSLNGELADLKAQIKASQEAMQTAPDRRALRATISQLQARRMQLLGEKWPLRQELQHWRAAQDALINGRDIPRAMQAKLFVSPADKERRRQEKRAKFERAMADDRALQQRASGDDVVERALSLARSHAREHAGGSIVEGAGQPSRDHQAEQGQEP